METSATDPRFPAALHGHWTSRSGQLIADDYADKTREELACPHLTDMHLANEVFMASRGDLDLILYQTAAKERIRWLSAQLALSHAALQQAEDHIVTMLSAIAGGNSEAGQRFAENDPVVVLIRAALRKATPPTIERSE